MALTAPGLTLSIEALFGHIKPQLDVVRRMGFTDFSKADPGIEIKPGATIKYPLSSVDAASVYDESTNNYLTGGSTAWGTLTATHYLQGFDLKGVNIDEGVNAGRIRQLFAARAGAGIAWAVRNAVKTSLDGATASTAVTLKAAPALADYDALGEGVGWLDKANATLVVNGAEWAKIKGVLHGAHLSATPAAAAEELGFRELVVLPDLTARAVIVPFSSVGFIARVPAIVANYPESGAETDEDSGLSVGIVVADDQAKNRQVVNADLWFGVALISASANATTSKGAIKVGTAS
ncbi:MAG: hypothetical protein ACI4RA_05520 [Kiritimatiellia bacterium]